MHETLLVAIVTGGVSLAVCLLNNYFQQGKTRALLEYKLDELTDRVNKHNNLVERTYKLEEHLAAAAELGRSCGVTEEELTVLLRRAWEESQ